MRQTELVAGRTRSCGCARENAHVASASANKTHGMSSRPEYAVWLEMKRRCTKPTHPRYPDYGGRGIQVCDRWLDSFQNFWDDMGPRPPWMSIERRNNDGDYTPENCVWATRKEQNRNRRSNRKVTFRGRDMLLVEAAEMAGLPYRRIVERLSEGWTECRALTTPITGRKNAETIQGG